MLLIAAGTRLYRLDAQSLWNDEGNSLRLAERRVSGLLDAAARDIHPPGYTLALKGWIALAGTSELALRLPSAFAGLLTVAAAIALGRQLYGPGAGALAGLFVALSPLAVYYSQEARMYAQLGLLAALRPLVNLSQRLRHGPQLPAPGQPLKGAYAGYVLLDGVRATTFGRLLEGLLELARRRGKSWLYLGLLENDPHLPVALQYPHTLYRSQLYRLGWPELALLELDDRPGYLELATL